MCWRPHLNNAPSRKAVFMGVFCSSVSMLDIQTYHHRQTLKDVCWSNSMTAYIRLKRIAIGLKIAPPARKPTDIIDKNCGTGLIYGINAGGCVEWHVDKVLCTP